MSTLDFETLSFEKWTRDGLVYIRAVGPFHVDGIRYERPDQFDHSTTFVRPMISLEDDDEDYSDPLGAARMRCHRPLTDPELRHWTRRGLIPA